MKVILGRSWSVGSLAIRLFTWSKWSHCAILLDDNTTLESTASLGVIQSNLGKFINKYPDYLVVDLPAYKGWENRARKHLGKPYDWGAIFGLVFRKSWSSPSKWFCSEYVADASGYFNDKYEDRITPQHIVMFGKEL